MAASGRHDGSLLIPPASGWTSPLLTLVTIAALLPAAVTAVVERGAGWLLLLLASAVTALVWQVIFARIRKRPIPLDGIATALMFSAVLPADVTLWQGLLALSFGVVVGEQIFGGRGYNFLHPAVAALAFLIFSFPGGSYDGFGEWSAWAVVPGAVILLLTGLLNWRILVAGLAGFIVVAYTGGLSDAASLVTAPAFVFGLVFFAGDPVVSSATNPGRWTHGALFGVLVAVFSLSAGVITVQPVVFAALLASVFAPLIDQAVIFANVSARRRRNG
jgi:Na+-transporting NADH:ubiquinone oxidoreductase subunit B